MPVSGSQYKGYASDYLAMTAAAVFFSFPNQQAYLARRIFHHVLQQQLLNPAFQN